MSYDYESNRRHLFRRHLFRLAPLRRSVLTDDVASSNYPVFKGPTTL
jgi:hypothetical protein